MSIIQIILVSVDELYLLFFVFIFKSDDEDECAVDEPQKENHVIMENFTTPDRKRPRLLPPVKKDVVKGAKRSNLLLQIPRTIDMDDDLTVPQTPQPGGLSTSPFALEKLSEDEPGKVSRVCYLDGSQDSAYTSLRRKGTTYLCSNEWRQKSGLSTEDKKQEAGHSKLFYHLGSGVYIDKPHRSPSYYAPNTNQEAQDIRIGLWYVNDIQKHQRAGSRYSVTLDFDALHLLKSNAAEIEKSLKICDSDSFLGHVTYLGDYWFLTVEHDQCSVNIRHWFALKQNQGDPEAELLPGREGFKLGYNQFRKLRVFLEKHLDEYLPSFKNHIFRCDRADHAPAQCPLCSVCGRLPLERNIQRLLGR